MSLKGHVNQGFDDDVSGYRSKKRESYSNAVGNGSVPKDSSKKVGEDAEDDEVPMWDVFEETTPNEFKITSSEGWIKMRKCCKVVLGIFCFVMILLAGALTKLTLLLVSTNLSCDIKCVCVNSRCSCQHEALKITSGEGSDIKNSTSQPPSSNGTTTNTTMLSSSIAKFASPVTPNTTSPPLPSSSVTPITTSPLFPTSTVRLEKYVGEMLLDKRIVWWAWSLLLILCFPYCVTFLKNFWKILGFRRPAWCGWKILAMTIFTESLHCTGVIMLTTVLLPKLDLLHCIMITMSLGVVPAIFRVFERYENCCFLNHVFAVMSCIVQIGSSFGLYVTNFIKREDVKRKDVKCEVVELDIQLLACCGASIFLISLRWWPNYFTKHTITFSSLRNHVLGGRIKPETYIPSYKSQIRQNNSLLHMIIACWKMLFTFFGVLISLSVTHNVEFEKWFQMTMNLEEYCNKKLTCDPRSDMVKNWDGMDYSPLIVGVVNVILSLFLYYICVHTLKTRMVKVAYALPLWLISPLCVLFIFTISYVDYLKDTIVTFSNDTSVALFMVDKKSFTVDFQDPTYVSVFWSIFGLLVFSQIYTSIHVWRKPRNKIAATERLFLLPMYDASCLDQSLLYNRTPSSRSRPKRPSQRRVAVNDIGLRAQNTPLDTQLSQSDERDPHMTQIYFCATMWHETDEEMLLMMKSVLRMDHDNAKKRNYQVFTGKISSDYYNFETHIFFDDAMKAYVKAGDDYQVNDYVKKLVKVVPDAVSKYYQALNLQIKDPVKRPTPYGGRLEWTLPGGTVLIAHLKDKMKIRHKKRWSQVMYMYYFLGKKLMDNHDWSEDDKEIASMNTYLLALDGDVDFQPEAVLLLVDMMKKNGDVGAACGRIHPMGGGPMVWYQKFEYAIAHWLQKATEHILGCVLCSPGCFSLFRGRALMDDNVMRRYATKSTEARHYLQYDQGEDRWLCTLIIQAGYKVEYNAASDAQTFAPENFDEFFKQRRRWGPSTMANVLDLLMDVKHVIKTNQYMSLLYIVYQAIQFCSSIIGPGTIFMMVTGAITLVFPTLPILSAFVIHMSIIFIYVMTLFFAKEDNQLKLARILAIVYALLMCLVVITILIKVANEPLSPDAIFFYTVFGSFFISALFHPQEFSNVLHVVTYYILIPCMYMLLIFYSFANINNVSWGTREVKPTQAEQQVQQEIAAQEAATQAAKKAGVRQSIVNIFKSVLPGSGSNDNLDEESGQEINLGGCCKIMCCPKSKKEQKLTEYQYLTQKIDKLQTMLYDVVQRKTRGSTLDLRRRSISDPMTDDEDDVEEVFTELPGVTVKPEKTPTEKKPVTPKSSIQNQKRVQIDDNVSCFYAPRDDLSNPFWADDQDTGAGEIIPTDDDENEFWLGLIEKYLKPLENNKDQQNKVSNQLQELRVKVNFGFILANAMFVVIVFAMQLKEDELSIPWPTPDGSTATSPVLSIILLSIFISVIGIQFVGMVFHRLGTFWHIMASTMLSSQTSATDEVAQHEKIIDDILEAGLRPEEEKVEKDSEDHHEDDDSGEEDSQPRSRSVSRIGRSNSVRSLKKIKKTSTCKTQPITSLDDVLHTQIGKISDVAAQGEEALEEELARTGFSEKKRRTTIKLVMSSRQAAGSDGLKRRATEIRRSMKKKPSGVRDTSETDATPLIRTGDNNTRNIRARHSEGYQFDERQMSSIEEKREKGEIRDEDTFNESSEKL